MTLTQSEITNLYAMATSPKLEKKIHHRYVPMMMYTVDSKEVICPMVVGTTRDIRECEEQAEIDTRAVLGDVALSNRGKGSTWSKTMDFNRSAWLIFTCTRLPGDLNKKFFESKQQVEDTYDPDEIGILMDHYATVRFSQPHYVMFEGEKDEKTAFQNVIDKIKKQGEESDFFLNSFTTHSVNQLIKYLVSLLPNSETITGTSGEHSNNITKTE